MMPTILGRAAAALVLVLSSAAEAAIVYVAPEGNDAWSGTLSEANAEGADGPFATLVRARDALRETAAAPGSTVYVRGGTYYLAAPLRLEAADSGTPEAPVVWQAYKNEEVVLSGGVVLEGFSLHEGGIVQCPLPGPAAKQLFVKGERQPLARWPNQGEGDIPGGGWAFIAGKVDEAPKLQFQYSGDRPQRWTSTAGVQVSIWPNYNWWQTIAEVTAIDQDRRMITLDKDLPYSIERGRRYFFQNVIEELDAPGEWFHDAAAGVLYLIPPAPLEEGSVVAPRLDHVIEVEGAAHINLIGLRAAASREDAVAITESHGCLFARSVVRNAGAFGVVVRGGASVRVVGNDIYDTGRGGIVIDGGDRKTLERADHQAVNNHIHHFGQIYQTYQTGVNVSGVGNRVAHNLIHDAPHIGILLNGNDHVLEYNELHHLCLQGADNGGFYMGRDWTQRGIVIRYNKFHDIYGFGLARLGPDKDGVFHYETPHQAWGVYLDDCSSGVLVEGNLFYRVPLCGVMVGGGRDNVVKNNIFVDCIPAYHIDDRWDAFSWDIMHERLGAMNYEEPPYSERYPELLMMGDDPRRPENNQFMRNIVSYEADDFRGLSTTETGPDRAVLYDMDQFDPESTLIDNNLIHHPEEQIRVAWSVYDEAGSHEVIDWAEWQDRGYDERSEIRDPMFVDPKRDNYQLHKKSPARGSMRFRPLPLSKMGLYKDEHRVSWPPPQDARRDGTARQSWPVSIPK